MAISIRKDKEIIKLERAGKMARKAVEEVQKSVQAGISTKELNEIAESFLKSKLVRPSFKGLYNYPYALITSVNEVVIHGLPSDYKLKNGDVIGLDLGVEIDDYYGDYAVTIAVGEVNQITQNLLDCSKLALDFAVKHLEAGMRFKQLSALLGDYIKGKKFFPLKNYCGHGIGTKPHEEPSILNYLEDGGINQGPKIKNGMVFCIEPMICQNSGDSKTLQDKWSVVSTDGSYTSHHEHMIAVINNKARILTIQE